MSETRLSAATAWSRSGGERDRKQSPFPVPHLKQMKGGSNKRAKANKDEWKKTRLFAARVSSRSGGRETGSSSRCHETRSLENFGKNSREKRAIWLFPNCTCAGTVWQERKQV